MLKIKIRFIGCLLYLITAIVIVTGCDKKDSVIDDESQRLLEDVIKEESALLMEDAEPVLNLTKVEKGDFIISKTQNVIFHYPNTEIIRYDDNLKASFVEFLCSLGDEVKAGDPLFSIEYHIDLIEYEKTKLSLLRAVEAYEEGREQRELQLQQEVERLDRIEDPIEEIKLSFNLEYLKEDLDNYIQSMELNIEDLRTKVSELESKMGTITITSPIDGYISYMNPIYPGEELKYFEEIITIVNHDEVYLLVDNSSGAFRYNMEVDLIANEKSNTVIINKGDNKSSKSSSEKTYKGRVISGDNLVTNDLKSNQAIIELVDGDISEILNMDVKATCNPVFIKNALLVNNRAVMYEDLYTIYVLVHDNGNIYKKYFVDGGRDTFNYLIFDGLEEGMEIITK